MTDDIIEIAAKVIYNNGYDEERSERHYATARAVIREVTPLIRAAALEEAIKAIESAPYADTRDEAIDALRALKEQP